jgi:S-ribosylhomocysteine lyase LuxS involved in autoinducer biosynthesis
MDIAVIHNEGTGNVPLTQQEEKGEYKHHSLTAKKEKVTQTHSEEEHEENTHSQRIEGIKIRNRTELVEK